MRRAKCLCVCLVALLFASVSFGQSSDVDTHPDQFINYGKTVKAQPARAYYPRTLLDVQNAVNDARTDGKQIRAVGTGHTFSDMIIEDGFYVVFTEFLNGITFLNAESDGGATVNVLTGTTNNDLRSFCEQYGYSYPANTVIDTLTIGGIISTGSYGTGWDVPTVSDYVTEIRIVDYQGRLNTYSRTLDEEAFRAAKLSLGLFGIVYDFQIKLDPMYRVTVNNQELDIDDTLYGNNGQNFRDLFYNHYSTRIFWYPFQKTLYVKTMDITSDPLTPETPSTPRQTLMTYLEGVLNTATADALKRWGWLTPRFWNQYYKTFPTGAVVQNITDAIHFENFDNSWPLTFLELGWNVSSTDTFSDLIDQYNWVMDKTYSYSESISLQNPRGKYPLNVALEFHCLGHGDSILSITTGNDKTCCIEIMSDVGTPNWSAFQKEVLAHWTSVAAVRATRPHWAKVTPDLPDVKTMMRTAYKPQIQQFQSVLARLDVDSKTTPLFANQWLKDVVLTPF